MTVQRVVVQKRMYQVAWEHLKEKQKVKLEVTRSKDAALFTRSVKTIRKAIQKEKYIDDRFRLMYPDALITSTLDADSNTITFHLELNIPICLADLASVPTSLGDL